MFTDLFPLLAIHIYVDDALTPSETIDLLVGRGQNALSIKQGILVKCPYSYYTLP